MKSILSLSSCLTILLSPARTSSLCFKKYTATRDWQTFTSPQYPIAFPPATRCIYRVEAPPGYKVKIDFIDFLLLEKLQSSNPPNAHCENQSLTLLNINGRDSDKAITLCGNEKPNAIVSRTQGFNIELNSNNVPYNYNYKGFQIKYRIEEDREPIASSRGPSNMGFRSGSGMRSRKPSSNPIQNAFKNKGFVKPSKSSKSSKTSAKAKAPPKVQARDWTNILKLQMAKTTTAETVTEKPKYNPLDHYCKPGYPCPKDGFFGEVSQLNQNNTQRKKRSRVSSTIAIFALVLSIFVAVGIFGHRKFLEYKEEQEKMAQKTNNNGSGSDVSGHTKISTISDVTQHQENQNKYHPPCSPTVSHKTHFTNLTNSNTHISMNQAHINQVQAHQAMPRLPSAPNAAAMANSGVALDFYGLPQKKTAKASPSYGKDLLQDYEIVKQGYSSQQTRNLANSKNYQVHAVPGSISQNRGNLHQNNSIHSIQQLNYTSNQIQNPQNGSIYQAVGNVSTHGLIMDQSSHVNRVPSGIARHMRKNLRR